VAADPSSTTSVSLICRLGREPTDQNAWRDFVARYGPKVAHWCHAWGLKESEAEDVTQAVLLRLSAAMSRFTYDPSRSFRGWLRTLARHAYADLLRGRDLLDGATGGRAGDEAIRTVAARDDLVGRLEGEFDIELMEEAFRRVRARVHVRKWEAFRLTAVEGLTGAEAAARLEMRVVTVYTARSKIQQLLRDELRGLDPTGPCD
jgi:RNA polymerase sigma-70 factor (ECF subfamily)